MGCGLADQGRRLERNALPEVSTSATERVRRWRRANPEKQARLIRQERLRRYGLSQERYDEKLAQQKNRCAICCKEFTTTPHIDHDHSTGTVRGLLCLVCNRNLACLETWPHRHTAAQYLDNWTDPKKA